MIDLWTIGGESHSQALQALSVPLSQLDTELRPTANRQLSSPRGEGLVIKGASLLEGATQAGCPVRKLAQVK